LTHSDSVYICFFKNFKTIQEYVAENGKIFLFMGQGQHKIKRKAEQIACNEAIEFIKTQTIDLINVEKKEQTENITLKIIDIDL
jgi:hypothetical protein